MCVFSIAAKEKKKKIVYVNKVLWHCGTTRVCNYAYCSLYARVCDYPYCSLYARVGNYPYWNLYARFLIVHRFAFQNVLYLLSLCM